MAKSKWTRREMLKTGLAISASAATGKGARPLTGLVDSLASTDPTLEKLSSSRPQGPELHASSPRERFLLDFGWHFHLGHASDPSRDFGFGAIEEELTFAKSGGMPKVTRLNFDDSGWRAIDLPHDWAVELPFKNVPESPDHGSKPLGRNYPETSIGWYRRVFELPESDASKRITVEFDGAFRNAFRSSL
jgi:beta-galactosidase